MPDVIVDWVNNKHLDMYWLYTAISRCQPLGGGHLCFSGEGPAEHQGVRECRCHHCHQDMSWAGWESDGMQQDHWTLNRLDNDLPLLEGNYEICCLYCRKIQ